MKMITVTCRTRRTLMEEVGPNPSPEDMKRHTLKGGDAWILSAKGQGMVSDFVWHM